MPNREILKLLEQVRDGAVSPEAAMLRLKVEPFSDLGYAKVDHHRALRQGAAEVIYGEGKTAAQIEGIARNMLANGQKTVLITRLDREKAESVGTALPLDYREICRIGLIGSLPEPAADSCVAVCSGGTSDMPVAEEAAVTAEALGSRVIRLYDVGSLALLRKPGALLFTSGNALAHHAHGALLRFYISNQRLHLLALFSGAQLQLVQCFLTFLALCTRGFHFTIGLKNCFAE